MMDSKFFIRSALLLAGFLCCFAPLEFMAADDAPSEQDSTLQTPPSLVYPLARRWPISSLFDHTSPGDAGSEDQHIAICAGDRVSDDLGDPNDQQESGSVWAYTDYDTDLKDLRWHHFRPGWLWYDRHYGYDYACPLNTDVVAATSGGTAHIGAYAVRVTHSSGYRTYYRHLNNRIDPGWSVQPGQWVGDSGDEGGLYGSHLHFEVRDPSGNYVDPCGWQGDDPDPWAYNVGNLWASGDPIPMGYRDQNNSVHGPYALDQAFIAYKWRELDGEPGSPLDDDFTYPVEGQDASGAVLYERIQPFEHGYINYISGDDTYYFPYAETYLPDVRASESSSGWNSTIIVRNEGAGSATVNVAFYTGDGRVLDSRTHRSVPSKGVWILDVRGALLDFLNQSYYQGVFEGQAIVYASQEVSAVVRTLSSSESLAYSEMPSQSSLGFNAGTRLFFPGFLKDFYGASSYTDVANVGSGPTTVQIRYYDGEGNRKGSDSHDLEANASYRFPIAEATASIGGIRVVSEDDEPLAASTTYRQIYGPRSGAHAALSVSGGGRIPSCPRQRASIPLGVRRGTALDSRESGTDRGWV